MYLTIDEPFWFNTNLRHILVNIALVVNTLEFEKPLGSGAHHNGKPGITHTNLGLIYPLSQSKP